MPSLIRLKIRRTSVCSIYSNVSTCGNINFGNFVNFNINTRVYKFKGGVFKSYFYRGICVCQMSFISFLRGSVLAKVGGKVAPVLR